MPSQSSESLGYILGASAGRALQGVKERFRRPRPGIARGFGWTVRMAMLMALVAILVAIRPSGLMIPSAANIAELYAAVPPHVMGARIHSSPTGSSCSIYALPCDLRVHAVWRDIEELPMQPNDGHEPYVIQLPVIRYANTACATRTINGWSSPATIVSYFGSMPPHANMTAWEAQSFIEDWGDPILVRSGSSMAVVWTVQRKKRLYMRYQSASGTLPDGVWNRSKDEVVMTDDPGSLPEPDIQLNADWAVGTMATWTELYGAVYDLTAGSWQAPSATVGPPEGSCVYSQTTETYSATTNPTGSVSTYQNHTDTRNRSIPSRPQFLYKRGADGSLLTARIETVTAQTFSNQTTSESTTVYEPYSVTSSTECAQSGTAYREDSLYINNSEVDSSSHDQEYALTESINSNNEFSGSATRTYSSPSIGEPLEEVWTREPEGWFKVPHVPGDQPSAPPFFPLEPFSWDKVSSISGMAIDRNNTAHVTYNREVLTPIGSVETEETRTLPFYASSSSNGASLLLAGDDSGVVGGITITSAEELVTNYYSPAVAPPGTNPPPQVERILLKGTAGWGDVPAPAPPEYYVNHFFSTSPSGELYIVSPMDMKKLAPGTPWPQARLTQLGNNDPAAFAIEAHGGPSTCSGAVFMRIYQPHLGDQDPFCTFSVGPNTIADISNGNLFFSLPVFSSNGRGISTGFSLFYNSLEYDRLAGPISPGWTHNYNIYLTADKTAPEDPIPSAFYLSLGDGRKVPFTEFAEYAGQSVSVPHGAWRYYARIERKQVDGAWFYLMTTKSGMRYYFDVASGKLRQIKDPNDNLLDLSYQDNQLTTVTDSVGRQTVLQYDDQKRLVRVVDPLDHTTNLTYSEGRLRSVQLPPASPGADSYEWRFLYHPLPDGDTTSLSNVPSVPTGHPENQVLDALTDLSYSHQPLAAIATPRGVAGRTETDVTVPAYGTRFYYYDDRRFGFSADAEDGIRSMVYEGDPTEIHGDLTAWARFRERNYSKTIVFYNHQSALASKIVDDEGNYVEREFDEYCNVVKFRDKNENITRYAYDEDDFSADGVPGGPWYQGGVPEPNPPYVHNNLLAIMQPGDTNLPPALSYYRYTADGFNRVERMLDPEEAETAYEYDSHGNLTKILYPDPEGGAAGSGGSQAYEYDTYGRIKTATDPNTGVTEYFYDEEGANGTGLVTSIKAPGASERERFEYDRMGNVKKRKPPAAAATTYQLDALYRVIKVIAPPNRTTEYAYDEDSNVIFVDPPQGASTTHSYDKLGRLRFTDTGDDYKSEHRYDVNGNVTWSKSNLTVSTFEYDSLSRLTREERTGAGHTNYFYNADSSLRKEERWGAHTESTQYEYDSRGQLIVTTRDSTGSGIHTQYEKCAYTAGGQLKKSWREAAGTGFVSGNCYDYDKRGRMTVSTQLLTQSGQPGDGPSSYFSYDNAGNRVGMTDPNGKNTYFEYDSSSRLICTRDHDQNITAAYDYNDDGQRTKVLVPSPQGGGLVVQQEFTYNSARELETTTSPADSSADECHYDSAGNIVRRIDAEGNFVEYVFDVYNRVVEMHEHPTMVFPLPPGEGGGEGEGLPVPTLDPSAIVTKYEYDQNGNRSKVIDPLGHEYCYEYNSLNQLIRIVYPPPALRQEMFQYDSLGNLTQRVDPNGQISTYVYDGFSRNVEETHTLNGEERQKILRTYDAAGNLATIEQTKGLAMKILYSYNNLNQMVATQWIVNGTPWKSLSYGYDLAGNRASMIGPEGEDVQYGYDSSNRLASITRTPSASEIAQGVYPQPLTCTFEYDQAGRRKQMVLANGVRALYNYDQKGRLENLRWSRSTGDTIASFSYCYNQIDNIMRKRLDHLNCDFDYSYNRVSWLTCEVCSGNADVTPPAFENQYATQEGGNESLPSNEVMVTPMPPTMAVPVYTSAWTYDNCGNREEKNSTIFGHVKYYYDEENRLLAEKTPEGDIVYGYAHDNNGNTISRTKWNGETEHYSYAWNNQMDTYVNAEDKTWSYMFTPEANRIAKVAPDESSEWYMYDGADVISDYSLMAGGSEYAYAASYIQKLGVDSKLVRLSTLGLQGGAIYFISDGLGTMEEQLDTMQNSVNVVLRGAWGERIEFGQPSVIHERYAGLAQREVDGESELQFMRHRNYASWFGRFLSVEPLHQDVPSNHFLYAANNPVNLSDPFGLQVVNWPVPPPAEAGGAVQQYRPVRAGWDAGENGRALYEIRLVKELFAPNRGYWFQNLLDLGQYETVVLTTLRNPSLSIYEGWPTESVGYYDGNWNEIVLSSTIADTTINTLLHELSHAVVDYRESWFDSYSELDEHRIFVPIVNFMDSAARWLRMFEDAAQLAIAVPANEQHLVNAADAWNGYRFNFENVRTTEYQGNSGLYVGHMGRLFEFPYVDCIPRSLEYYYRGRSRTYEDIFVLSRLKRRIYQQRTGMSAGSD